MEIIYAKLLRGAFFNFLFSSPSHTSFRIIFCPRHFARSVSRKTELRKNCLHSESIAKHKGFRDSRVNFTTKLMVVNFLSPDGLSYLRAQLKAFVGGVCFNFEARDLFLIAVFSNKRFFPTTQLKGSIALKFGHQVDNH